ncbi:MAG TPA: DUF3068 domain-containing protein [Phycicoccus sp.]|nr:DUF3068 domain-containing protein [Phycicoccus sp.]
MRRYLGAALVVLGAFLLGLGLLAKPYLYTKLATVPLDQQSTSVSVGHDMSVLYPHAVNGSAALDKLKGVTVKSTRTVQGIPGLVADKNLQDTTAFWQTQVKSQAEVDKKWVDLSYSDEGVSIDRVNAQIANCCGDYKSVGDLDNPQKTQQVTREGLFFKFPFDVQKQSYPWWDGDQNKANPIDFKEEADLFGTKVYVFSQTLPVTEVASRDGIPATLFSPTATGTVTAKVMYGNTRTLWVEPVTGVIIKGEEKVNKNLVSSLGTVPMTVGTIGYDEATIKDNADTWGTKAGLLAFIKNTFPMLGILLGLALIAGGLLLVVRGRGSAAAPAASAQPRVVEGGAGDVFGEGDATTRRRRDLQG